jgi:transcriptional regulator with XRE-family HTH domain
MNEKQRRRRNQRFRVARAYAGLSQRDVAEQIGVDESTLSKVLAGTRKTPHVVEAIEALIEEHHPRTSA